MNQNSDLPILALQEALAQKQWEEDIAQTLAPQIKQLALARKQWEKDIAQTLAPQIKQLALARKQCEEDIAQTLAPQIKQLALAQKQWEKDIAQTIAPAIYLKKHQIEIGNISTAELIGIPFLTSTVVNKNFGHVPEKM
jgi:gas vesicle protein